MEEEVREDIISVLKEAEKLILNLDSQRLKQISDHTLHNSSTYQDEDSILIATLIYSIGKISEKEKYQLSFKAFANEISKEINLACNALEKKDEGGYRYRIKQVFKALNKLVDNIG